MIIPVCCFGCNKRLGGLYETGSGWTPSADQVKKIYMFMLGEDVITDSCYDRTSDNFDEEKMDVLLEKYNCGEEYKMTSVDKKIKKKYSKLCALGLRFSEMTPKQMDICKENASLRDRKNAHKRKFKKYVDTYIRNTQWGESDICGVSDNFDQEAYSEFIAKYAMIYFYKHWTDGGGCPIVFFNFHNIGRACCRQILMTHVNIIDDLLKYPTEPRDEKQEPRVIIARLSGAPLVNQKVNPMAGLTRKALPSVEDVTTGVEKMTIKPNKEKTPNKKKRGAATMEDLDSDLSDPEEDL